MFKMYKKLIKIVVLAIICIFVLVGCSNKSIRSIKYEYIDDGPRVGYSIDIVDQTKIKYEITPEVAAYIAKGVFINVHGEDYVNERVLKVYDNTELLSDVDKYGHFYKVSLNKPNHTDGEYIAISKEDGRILKLYRFE